MSSSWLSNDDDDAAGTLIKYLSSRVLVPKVVGANGVGSDEDDEDDATAVEVAVSALLVVVVVLVCEEVNESIMIIMVVSATSDGPSFWCYTVKCMYVSIYD